MFMDFQEIDMYWKCKNHEQESCNDYLVGLFPRFLALCCNLVDIIDGTI